MSLDVLTLIGTVIVTPVLAAISYVVRRRWNENAAELKRYLDKIDVLQERIFTMQQDQIKAEMVRAASTGDTNQLLKALTALVDTQTKKAST